MNHSPSETPQELQYASLYQSEEWKQVDPISRAQLLLVLEGLKPGVFIGAEASVLYKLLESTEYRARALEGGTVFEVGTEQHIQNYKQQSDAVSDEDNAEHHRINGRFLGYPECCTEEYITQKKFQAHTEERALPEQIYYNYAYEVALYVLEGKSYPPQLEYCPPSFTPCSITCPEALALLQTWKELLDEVDPEAAQVLRNGHLHDYRYLQRILHKEMQEIQLETQQHLQQIIPPEV